MANGNLTGTTSSKFRAVLEFRVSNYGENKATLQYRAYVQVTKGNFAGSSLTSSWGKSAKLYGEGTYADSGWVTMGDYSYGVAVSKSVNASYTGGSGTTYKSSVTSSYTATAPVLTPKAPTSVRATRNSDTKITVQWVNNTSASRKYTSLQVQRSVDGGSFTTIKTGLGASTTSYADTTTSANHYYQYKVVAVNTKGSATSSATSSVFTTPAPCSNVVNTRNSDTKNTITWTRGTTNNNVYSSIKIKRSIDGASYVDLATLSATATSYIDTSTNANHSYQYSVAAINAAGSSSAAYSGATYNTPCAPSSLTCSRSSESGVVVAIENAAKTATALELQRSTDGQTWETVSTTSGIVTSINDSPGAGTFYYRARNTRDSLVSAWTQAASAVVTICAPNAPTLVSPLSSGVVAKSQETITFSWLSNHPDGSVQEKAELAYSTDNGGTWQTATITGASNTYSVDNSFELNLKVSWKVRTKGAHADWGSWSSVREFSVYQEPTVSILAPSNDGTIDRTPVTFTYECSDESGDVANASLVIYEQGTAVYSVDVTRDSTIDITKEEWLPENGATYSFELSVRSTSTLQASETITATVAYTLPKPLYIGLEPDRDTGYITISVYPAQSDESAPEVVNGNIYRVVDGVRTLVAKDALNTLSIIDKYAPLNTDFYYEAVGVAESGAVRTTKYDGRIDCPFALFYFEDKIARSRLNPTDSISLKSPNVTYKHYAGRKYPVAYDDEALDDTRSFSGVVESRDDYLLFVALMNQLDSGRCVFKTLYGDVMHAKVNVSLKPSYTLSSVWGSVDIDATRIDGEVL